MTDQIRSFRVSVQGFQLWYTLPLSFQIALWTRSIKKTNISRFVEFSSAYNKTEQNVLSQRLIPVIVCNLNVTQSLYNGSGTFSHTDLSI